MSSRCVTAIAAVALASVPLLASPQDQPKAAQKPVAKAGAKTEITWYGHAAFVVKTPGGTVLAIDPWFQNPKTPDKEAGSKLEKVDYILVSHGHFDHVGETLS